MPKVSVIVPCWNTEKYLDRCLQSLVTQTLEDIEIILVDDYSPDTVPQLCDSWARKDPRISVVHKPKNEGLGMACNSGIEAATGEFIAFCDSDDWLDHDMYKSMYSAAVELDAQIVYTGLRRVDENGKESLLVHPSKKLVLKSRDAINGLMLDMIASKPSDSVERHIQMSAKVAIYSKKLIDTYSIKFESERKIISEDLVYNTDILIHSECVVVLPEYHYNYFCNTQSITTKVRTDRFNKNLDLREVFFSRYASRALPVEFATRVNRMFIGYARTDTMLLCKATSISLKERTRLLNIVCRNPVWMRLQNEYPVSQMPLVHKIVFLCIRYKFMLPLFILAKLK